jgi:hypothetical protein
MSALADDNSSKRARRKPAWLISCLLHVGMAVALLAAIRHQAGGASSERGDGGIVLERHAVEGADQTSDSLVRPAVFDTSQQLSPPTLLVADPAAPAPAVNPTPSASQPPKQSAPASQKAAPNGSNSSAGRYGPASDGKASVRVFGVQGTGTKFVYVFDRSSSMEGAPLAAAKQQLIQSINSLDTIHQFQIIFFNHQMRTFDASGGGHRIAFATERSKQLATKFIGGITADGGTDRMTALRAAVAMQPDVIFFLTDADDPMPDSEVAEVVQLNRRANAAICTIQFGEGAQPSSDNFLVELAKQSGGQYGYVDTTKLGK